jgi:protein TonB
MLPNDSQKSYRKHTSVNLAAGLLLTLLLVNTAFNWKFAHPLTDEEKTICTFKEWPIEPPPPVTIPEPKPPVELPPAVSSPPTTSSTIIEVIDSEPVEPVSIIDELDKFHTPTPPPVVIVPATTSESIDENTYSAPASPKEGLDKFMQYMMDNVKYPSRMRSLGISGTVKVSFIVDEEGKVSEVKVANGLDPELDRQIKEILLNSPEWIPAYFNGQPTISRRILPITFTLK